MLWLQSTSDLHSVHVGMRGMSRFPSQSVYQQWKTLTLQSIIRMNLSGSNVQSARGPRHAPFHESTTPHIAVGKEPAAAPVKQKPKEKALEDNSLGRCGWKSVIFPSMQACFGVLVVYVGSRETMAERSV